MIVRVELSMYSVLDTVVISCEDVCCCVVGEVNVVRVLFV